MRKGLVTLIAAGGLGLAALSGAASARSNIDIGISFGIPAPVYVAPRPVYYPAPPVYVAPPPVYVAPPPVYYGPPRYYAPPVYYGPGGHRGWHHRHHR